jgi:DNA repair photolyase
VRPVSNPPNPWESAHAEFLGEPPQAQLQVFEENSRSIIAENDSPDVGFRFSVNPYRGCFHACAYCISGETPILLADGRTRAIADVRVGDEIYGTEKRGRYRYYSKTRVLDHWQTVKPAFRVTLEDGTTLIASADHRFFTNRGWKNVAARADRLSQRPYLTRNNHLLGTGAFVLTPAETIDYRTGYLCGMIRGDALLASYSYPGRRRANDRQHHFRLALVDLEALQRTRRFLLSFDVETHEFEFQAAAGARKSLQAIRTHSAFGVAQIRETVAWPKNPNTEWRRGFLAGIFDAEGSYSRGVLRIANTDLAIIQHTSDALQRFGFNFVVETPSRDREKPVLYVRVRRGLREHLRFFHTVDPAITRKRNICGQAIKNNSALRVASVEALGVSIPMFDITTGTGDFIANGVVSHNCYARPTHQYLGFGAGTDFETKIVVKVNAPQLLRRELSRKELEGETLVFSGVTDCYQPLEAVYSLTRRCLEICREFRQPVGIVTKGALVRRDADLLAGLARETGARVYMSIAFEDDETARRLEPNVALPSQRFEALEALASAGVPVGIALAPIIPGINDSDIPALLRRAREAGATRSFMTLLRLPAEVLPVFEERLTAAFPLRVKKVWSAIEQMRSGRRNESRFGARMRGVGPRWKAAEVLYQAERRRLRFSEDEEPRHTAGFQGRSAQGSLFDL